MLRVFIWGLVAALAFAGPVAAREPENGGGILRAAWVPTGTGLISPTAYRPVDLQILQEAARRAHLGIVILPMGRAAAEAALADGGVDLLLPDATARKPVSIPYRVEDDVLLCARSLPAIVREGAAALEEAYGRGWRIGFVREAPYRADLATLMTQGGIAGRTSYFGNASEATGAVVAGAVDCLVAPRLSILSALGAMPGNESFVARKAIDLGDTELRLRFAGTVAPATVAALDAALAALREDGTIADLVERAARPVLLRFAVSTWWFSLLDVVGTIAFALSGVLIARAERFSFLGAFVLAGLPAVGGGVVRDLLLGRSPIGILDSPQSLFLILATVVVSYVAMTVAQKTGMGSSGRLRTSFYAEVCVLWGAVLTLAIIYFVQADQPELVRITIGLTVLGGFATRMAAVAYGLRSPRF